MPNIIKVGSGSPSVNDTLPPLNRNLQLHVDKVSTNTAYWNAVITADKFFDDEKVEMLAGGVWVYGDHLPKNPKDGTVIEWKREDLVTHYPEGLYKLFDIEPSTPTKKVIVNLYELKNKEYVKVPYIYIANHSYSFNDRCCVLLRDIALDEKLRAYYRESLYEFSDVNANIQTFKETLHSKIKEHLNPTLLPYHPTTNTTGTISDSVFAVTTYFLNNAPGQSAGSPSYFDNSDKRICYNSDNIAITYLTTDKLNSTTRYQFNEAGVRRNGSISMPVYIRPIIQLNNKTIVQKSGENEYDFYIPTEETTTFSLEIPTIKVRWPKNTTHLVHRTNPFYVRQFTYNYKGEYQTTLEGAVLAINTGLWSNTFGENSPEQIQAAIDAGVYKDIWNLGDEINIPIGKKEYTFVILGFDHDDLADGSGKAAITLGMKHLLADTYQMNTESTVKKAFYGSAFNVNHLTQEIYSSIPDEWKSVIKPVLKKTGSLDELYPIVQEHIYNLFLLSNVELFSTSANTIPGEGQVYAYIKKVINNIRFKKLDNGNGESSGYWTRSIIYDSNNPTVVGWWIFPASGAGNPIAPSPTKEYGICFGFCI